MKKLVSFLSAASLGGIAMQAHAHVSVSGPAFANVTQEVTFGVGHGCAGADTYKVRIQIPAGVTSVRAVDSDFGRAVVEKDEAGTVKAVTWTKPDANVLAEDVNYYKLTLRLKAPNDPFTKLPFLTTQTCKSAAGLTVVEWSEVPVAAEAGAPADAAVAHDSPAPLLVVVPARAPGWNKYVTSKAITDLPGYFKDAAIVWVGNAAYSANETTAALIKTEPNTQVLSSIPAGAEIWVRY